MIKQCPDIPFILFVYIIEGYKLLGRQLDLNSMYIRQYPLKADPSKKIILILEDSFRSIDEMFKNNKLNLNMKKVNPSQRNLSDF